MYRKVVNLLIEEWDLQRSISRGSSYSEFEIDRKFEFLSYLGYFLTTEFNKTTFNTTELDKAYLRICSNFGLPEGESKKVVYEIESHNGIFLQSGYDKYEFAHKSIQEYLAAEYFVKLPTIPVDNKILKIPSEIALAVSLSSNPTLYFVTLITEKLIQFNFSLLFYNSFLDRLVLEKPDFYLTPELGIATSSLFTSSYFNYIVKRKKNHEAEFNKWLSFFRRFADLPIINDSIELLNEYYFIRRDDAITVADIAETSSILNLHRNDIHKLIRFCENDKIKVLMKYPRKRLDSRIPAPTLLLEINQFR